MTTTTIKELREMIEEAIYNMSNDDLLYLYNEYCDYTNCYEDRLYFMEDFNEVCAGMNPYDIVLSVQLGDFRTNDRYFLMNGYGNFKSFDDVAEVIVTDDIVDYIVDNDASFGNDEIQSILEEFETKEEDYNELD
jgi:hypothetical protein